MPQTTHAVETAAPTFRRREGGAPPRAEKDMSWDVAIERARSSIMQKTYDVLARYGYLQNLRREVGKAGLINTFNLLLAKVVFRVLNVAEPILL